MEAELPTSASSRGKGEFSPSREHKFILRALSAYSLGSCCMHKKQRISLETDLSSRVYGLRFIVILFILLNIDEVPSRIDK